MSDALGRLQAALAGRYAVEREVGAGGMATVYLATDLRHQRRVALKVLRPDLAATVGAERFLQEVRVTANLQHPHILPLFDSGEADGFLYFVMPFIEGDTLRERLLRNGEFPILEVARLLRDIVEALAAAHAKGVVHRDIKPENIMLSGNHAMVADFGVAKAVSEATGRRHPTTQGAALGTPAYMAPEQVSGEPDVDHRADIYAVGVVGYELLVGRPPFSGKTAQQVLTAQVMEAPRPVREHRPSVPPALEAVLMRCLEKKAADRWQSAEEMLLHLEALATPSGGMTPRDLIPLTGPARKRGILGAVVVLSLVFGGAGAYVLATRGAMRRFGPEEVAAGEAATAIAVVPFTVTGGDNLALWREGMVDLLATSLDGLGGFRTIDSRTVLARWREKVRGSEMPDLRTVLEAAAATDARYGVVGSVVGNPAGIRVSAAVYDLSTGDKIAEAAEDGSAEDVLALTNSLSVAIVRGLLGSSAGGFAPGQLEAVTTGSLTALRAYLEGEAAMRHANFASAVAAYERAVATDSLFAMAWYRLSEAYGWLESIGSEAGVQAAERAVAMLERLPPRERLVVRAAEADRAGDVDFYGPLKSAVQRYPDDPDIWYHLGDFIYHLAMPVGLASPAEAAEAFERAIQLDPGFGPYQVHPIEFAIARGDRAGAEARAKRYAALTQSSDRRRTIEYELAIPLLLGDSAEAAEAIRSSRDVDMDVLIQMLFDLANRLDRNDRLFDLLWANRDRDGADHQGLLYLLITEGQIVRADRLLDSLDLAAARKGVAEGFLLEAWSTGRTLPNADVASPATCASPSVSPLCLMFVGWGLARSGDVSKAKESGRRLRAFVSDIPDQELAATLTPMADVVEGAVAAAEGRTDDARRLLSATSLDPGITGSLARAALGDLELSAGNTTEGIRYLEGNLSSYDRTRATLALARMHDRRREEEEARAYYRSFLTMTRRGDPDLPEIVEAREALGRLGG